LIVKTSLETPRLLIRPWRPDDAPQLRDAISDSTDELRRFTPWVIPESPELSTLVARIHAFRDQLSENQSWVYGIFDRDDRRVIGQIGLYARVGPGALELGYFIRSDSARRGYATEAATAMIDAAFGESDTARVEIRCDPANVASVAIAQRLGFELREIREVEAGAPLMIWDLQRELA
jgi:RimJ/RimL family protein N-acetyltransferase